MPFQSSLSKVEIEYIIRQKILQNVWLVENRTYIIALSNETQNVLKIMQIKVVQVPTVVVEALHRIVYR